MEENENENQNDKNEEINNNDKSKDLNNIELLIQEIKKKDELIENLQKENIEIKELIKKNSEEIALLKTEINNLKEKNENEINSLKELFKKKYNYKEKIVNKEDINNIINNKDDINNIINNKDDDDLLEINNKNENKKEDNLIDEIDIIKNLNDKYKNFEATFENKLDLIQKSLSKLMIKEGIEKDYSKEFENLLNKIFRAQNDKIGHVDKKDLEQLKNISIELMKNNGPSPLEKTRNYFEKNLNKRINEINDKLIISNLAIKKNEIFEFIDNLELELNFNIPKFRKEFNLPKEDYSDEFLLLKLKENNWDKNKAFCAIINQNYS